MLGAAMLIAGCGSSSPSHAQSSRELALERAQFEQVTSQLGTIEPAMKREVAASRVAWPSIAGGLPQSLESGLHIAVSTANANARALPEPPFLPSASKLTGPASGIAGIYENYEQLAQRGWNLTEAAVQMIASAGSATTNATATSANAAARQASSEPTRALYRRHLRWPLHFSLLGKSLMSGYEKLGGARSVRGQR